MLSLSLKHAYLSKHFNVDQVLQERHDELVLVLRPRVVGEQVKYRWDCVQLIQHPHYVRHGHVAVFFELFDIKHAILCAEVDIATYKERLSIRFIKIYCICSVRKFANVQYQPTF